MSIQSNINQSLSLLSLLVSQSPVAEAGRAQAVEKAKIRAAEKNVKLAGKAEAEALDKYTAAVEKVGARTDLTDVEKEAMDLPEGQIWKETMSAETQAHERLTQLNPTEKNVAGLVNRRRAETEQAEIDLAAQDALRKEHERLARSRDVIKTITEGVPLSPQSEKYVNTQISNINKKIGGTK
jgi:hypothetical protein